MAVNWRANRIAGETADRGRSSIAVDRRPKRAAAPDGKTARGPSPLRRNGLD
jgi:hypothetical protein